MEKRINISEDVNLTEIFNEYFGNTAKKLGIIKTSNDSFINENLVTQLENINITLYYHENKGERELYKKMFI